MKGSQRSLKPIVSILLLDLSLNSLNGKKLIYSIAWSQQQASFWFKEDTSLPSKFHEKSKSYFHQSQNCPHSLHDLNTQKVLQISAHKQGQNTGKQTILVATHNQVCPNSYRAKDPFFFILSKESIFELASISAT